jgi:hypothetical protein
MPRVDKGKLAEHAFAVALLERGITPNWPSVETEPYDLIASVSTALTRIQVKGTEQVRPQLRLSTSTSGKLVRYTKQDVDIVAIWIRPLDMWYLVPIEEIKGQSISIRPELTSCKWKKYQEAWHLLGIDEPTT